MSLLAGYLNTRTCYFLVWVHSVLYISSLRHVSANVMLRVPDYLSSSSYLFIVFPFRSKFSSNNIRRTNWGQYNCRRNSYYNCYSWGSKQRFLDFHFVWDTSRGLYDDKRCVVSNFDLDGHFLWGNVCYLIANQVCFQLLILIELLHVSSLTNEW